MKTDGDSSLCLDIEGGLMTAGFRRIPAAGMQSRKEGD